VPAEARGEGVRTVKSVRLQLLVTLLAVTTVVGVFAIRGLPPRVSMFYGAMRGDVGAVRRNIRWGEDVNAKDRDGRTPLYFAIRFREKDVATLLVANGADVTAKDFLGLPLLHSCFDKDISELLIAKGADVNAKVKGGGTALDSAIMNGQKDVADLLRRHGARE